MMYLKTVVLWLLFSFSRAESLKFPSGFKFGAATSAYQSEGAWNVSDKGETIWDHFTHTSPESIAGRSNGDVTCDSYHHWRRDIDMMSELGLHFYRFSIAWSRILPDGFPNYVSQDGINHYNNLINELVARGIEPVVTLYHWDLPQKLQEYGGWTNPLVSDWFADYANLVYSLFADRVNTWITINEPLIACEVAFNSGILAPGLPDPDRASYVCSKNILIAHAKAWRIYDRQYKPKYKGKVSLANHILWCEGEDDELVELTNQYGIGRFSHPVFSKKGGWPPAIEKIIADNSKKQGYPRSRLPAFSKYEIELVRGTYDYYALNHYSSRIVRKSKTKEKLGPWPMEDLPELETKLDIGTDWDTEGSSFFPTYPKGLRNLMNWIKGEYGDVEIFITENGYSNKLMDLDDHKRILFIKEYLKQVLLAIKEDGINVTGYTYWCLMDDFEWMDGFTTKFGLYAVDFTDPDRPRIPRKSSYYYASIIRSHSLAVPVEPLAWVNSSVRHQLKKKNSANSLWHSYLLNNSFYLTSMIYYLIRNL